MSAEGAAAPDDSPPVRLFVALDLPDAPRERLARWRDELVAGRDDLRPVAAEALHVTLVFLGSRPESDVEAIAAAAFAPLAGLATPRLRPRAVLGVPRRRPRLFALDLLDRGEATAKLHAAMSGALEAAGHHRPERRRFWPHVTLARVKRDRRAAPLGPLPAPEGAFDAGAVVLYRSLLRPQGAIYEPLAQGRVGDSYPPDGG